MRDAANHPGHAGWLPAGSPTGGIVLPAPERNR